jgi:DHA2 family multidrug resistance protein
MALKQLFAMAHRQGLVMAFADVFLALTVLFVAVGVGALVMQKPAAPAGGGAGGH